MEATYPSLPTTQRFASCSMHRMILMALKRSCDPKANCRKRIHLSSSHASHVSHTRFRLIPMDWRSNCESRRCSTKLYASGIGKVDRNAVSWSQAQLRCHALSRVLWMYTMSLIGDKEICRMPVKACSAATTNKKAGPLVQRFLGAANKTAFRRTVVRP